MEYYNAIEHKLGMDAVRTLVKEECVTVPASEHVDAMSFCQDFDLITKLLNETSEMVQVLQAGSGPSLFGLVDVRPALRNIQAAGTYIDVEELGQVRASLRVMQKVRVFFTPAEEDCPYRFLTDLVSGMIDCADILRVIDRVLSPSGTVKDTASTNLAAIRSRLTTIQGRISGAMRRVVARAVSEGIVDSDAQPSVRDGRLVLPVAAMNKRKLAGIVHDESATGKTIYIEPAEIVELHNEQRELELEERREIVKILIEVADCLRPDLKSLLESFAVLYYIDFIRAKAQFAIKTGGEMPQIKDGCVVEWHDARHPILKLALESRNKSVVPLNIDLTADTARILVISGPNAGGKSVALKTVGINQYMLQCGLLPVMEPNSRVGIFDGIFVDMGDDQSLEDDLSTYSSHLRNMKFILNRGTDRSMILIDEFGAGTEPQIGGAIAQALLMEFNRKGMWGVVTTHYQNLKQMAQDTPGIVNGSMVYDRQHMQPTFRLVSGNPGSSFAVEIALRTGLPKSIIDEAENIVGSDYFNLDKYLLDINRDRRYWENKRADIKRKEKHLEEVISRYEQNAENLRQQRRSIIAEAKTEADNIIARSNAAVEKAIHDIRRGQADKEETRRIRQQLAEERREIAESNPRENEALKRAPKPKKRKGAEIRQPNREVPVVGDNVLLDNQGHPGQILEIQRDKAVVSFGLLKMTVPLDRLSKTIRKSVKATEDSSALSSQTIEASRQRQLTFKTEIDVRGMRADEAIQAVTYFIDDALQFNAGRVRILHGTGTGALRMAIRSYLKTLPGVTSFHDEDVRFGGAGITVVNL